MTTERTYRFQIDALYPHQQRDADRPERYKALLWGRRAGKTRMAYYVAVLGHGPSTPSGEPLWKGLRHGYDVLWIGRSLDQARAIWDEAVKPAFRKAFGEGATNETHRIATFPGGGRLIVTSQDRDSINNARGKGDRIIGVVCDEVCHWDDAEDVWLSVLVPLLADNYGWAVLISTSEPGSWFNQLIDEIEDGQRPGWHFSERTARDNPRITREAFEALVAEYRPDDPRLAKEVYAKRFAAGAGLMFPMWRKEIHVLPATFGIPPHWRYFAGLDWGRSNPGCFVLLAAGPDRTVIATWDYKFQDRNAYDVGQSIGYQLPELGMPEWVAFDNQMNTIQDGGLSILDRFAAGLHDALPQFRVPLVAWPKGAGSRRIGVEILAEYLSWKPDKAAPERPADFGWPHLQFRASARYCVASLPRLLKDEKKAEDIAQGQDDHAFDALRGALLTHAPRVERPRKDVPDDVHPGFRADFTRRARERTADAEREDALIAARLHGLTETGRYGPRA